jgi:hypothetical protein
MKRKLISYDLFNTLQERSLSTVEQELIEAEDVLAAALDVDGLELFTFSESDVTYKTPDDNFIHATYTVTDNQVILEDIQELIVDEDSEKLSAREKISNMIDSLLENDNSSAEELFESYMSLPSVRRGISFNEATDHGSKKKSPLKGRKQSPAAIAKRTRARDLAISKMTPTDRKKLGRKKNKNKAKFYQSKMMPKAMKEWSQVCENVLGYANFLNNGSVINETAVKTDDHGDVSAVAMPTSKAKKQGKVLTMGFKTMDTELKVIRGNMKNVSEDQTFIKAMADLKRYNNVSDNSSLEESLEAIVSYWPDILFVTEEELAQQINIALSTANVGNYDNDTCTFMAEAILRTAHNAYTDKVRKIASLAGATSDVTAESSDCEDAYREFSVVSADLFNKLDENNELEVRIFGDLYNALHSVYKIAEHTGDEGTRIEVADMMRECYAIINSARLPDMELAESIANYLSDLLESDDSEHSDKGWDHGVEVDELGDHPMTKWNAKQSGIPSNNLGGWKDAAPVSDGKSYHGHSDEMGHNALANHGKNTWPNINNPIHPKSIFPKMKEKSVVDEDGLATLQKDTWPNLSNPMAPKPILPKPVK